MTPRKPPRPALSIAAAWDEANAFIRAELPLLAPVALAFLALPAAVSELVAPDPVKAATASPIVLLAMVLALLQLYGAVAITILALKPGLSVAEALRAAARRMPSATGLAALSMLAMLFLLLPMMPYLPLPGVKPYPPGGAIALYMIALAAGAFWASVRLVLTTAAIAAEAINPVTAIRRSFALTTGQWWRLFGFCCIFGLFALIVLLATTAGLGALILMVGRLTGLLDAAQAVRALASAIVTAGLWTWLLVVLARIYARLSGWSSGI